MTREEIDKYHEDLLRRIRESKEPIPVRGILHKSDDSIKPETFEDGIDPDPDDWETQSKFEGLGGEEVKERVIPQAETSEMDKHLITWKENGVDHQAVFYLPEGVNINDWVWDLLNYAEMNAEDYRLNYEVLP